MAVYWAAHDPDLARGDPQVPVDDAEEGGFPGAAGSGDEHQLTLRDIDADLAKGGAPTTPADQAADFDHAPAICHRRISTHALGTQGWR